MTIDKNIEHEKQDEEVDSRKELTGLGRKRSGKEPPGISESRAIMVLPDHPE